MPRAIQNIDQNQLERVVQEVVRRVLQAKGSATPTPTVNMTTLPNAALPNAALPTNEATNEATNGSTADGTASGSPQDTAKTKQLSKDNLSLSQKLITLELLRGKLDGVKSLHVIEKAIVTPAVLDELKDKSIELNRGSSLTETKYSALDLVTIAYLESESGAVTKKLKEFGKIENRFRVFSAIDLKGLLTHDELDKSRISVVLTEKPFRTCANSNKCEKTNAIYAKRPQDVTEAQKEFSLDLVIANLNERNNVLTQIFETVKRSNQKL